VSPVIPVVDLSQPTDQVASEIDAACTRIGFFQIVGHGVDPSLEAAAWAAAHDLFGLPLASKLAVAIPAGDAYGYGRFRVERLAASQGEHTPPDLKETFSVGPFGAAPAMLDDPSAAFVYSANRWPVELPDLERTLHGYYDALAGLVERVMAAMALGLGLADHTFASAIDRHTSALRALHYPDLTGTVVEPGQLRAGAHSDYGTLTLLRQDDAPGGLQVRDVDGSWHDVPATPGAYVVNVGDALARWTNDRWRSTVHRVVVPPADAGRDCERFSMAFFHNANWDAVIECLATCTGPGNPPRYAPITAGRHLMEQFRSTQGSYG
jgi:isopenicillin N synthase-like dioxygenase